MVFLAACTWAQDLTLSGSVQSDMLLPQSDERTGAQKTEDFMTNTYADLLLQSRRVDAGLRLEYLEHPLPGFENDFEGWGVPHFWVKGRLGQVELTAGTFYEQFGSGFILRTYEERSLGIDNALLGGRVIVKPVKGPWSDDFTIGEGDTRTLEYQQTIDAAWNASCLSVVAFVYNDEGVQQAVKARVEN